MVLIRLFIPSELPATALNISDGNANFSINCFTNTGMICNKVLGLLLTIAFHVVNADCRTFMDTSDRMIYKLDKTSSISLSPILKIDNIFHCDYD